VLLLKAFEEFKMKTSLLNNADATDRRATIYKET
jgi:hypothetical protein